MKMKYLKFFAVAAGLALATPSFGGDIYEIRRCDSTGAALAAEWTLDNPLTVAGQKLYFVVRLANRHDGTGYRKWGLYHKGSNSQVVDDALFPLAIGIYVSGQLQSAKLVNIDTTREAFTDLIFAYETQSGDFALPVLLATEGGKPAGHQGAGAQYTFDPTTTDKWEIRQLATAGVWATGDEALAIWSQGDPPIPVAPPEGVRETDTTLANCGFYVQTVDFDRTLWAAEGTVWREVHEGSNVSKPGDPVLAAEVPLATARKLYVWSADDTIVKAAESGGAQEVVISKDATSKSFKIYGVAQNNATELYLSAFPGKNTDQSGNELVDYIKIPVRCIEPQPATLSVTPSVTQVQVDGDYMTSKATLNVALSQAYPGALKVRVTPTFNDDTADNIGDYVRFSTVGTEVTVLPGFAIPEVTIPAGSTSPQQIHVFFLKADAKTYGTSGRLKFTPSIVDDPTADLEIRNKEAGGIAATAAKPVVITPAENAEVGGTCGEDFDFVVEVSDTYADMDYFDATGASGYQIFVKNRPSDAFKALPGFYYVGENGQLFLVTEDEATPGTYVKSGKLPQLNYPVSSGEDYFTSQVYVKAPLSGKQSESRVFRARIGAPRTSTLEITDLVDGVVKTTYREGEYMAIKVSLSEVNDTGASIYAYLLPNDGAREEIYKGTTMFVLKGGDAAADATVKGLEIKKNQREATGRIMLLDGASEADGGRQISFEVVLTTSPTFDPGAKLDGYESNFIDITVNNVEPLIKRLEMNGFESENDLFTYPQSLPRGMERKFKAVVSDAGSFDLNNGFKTKWTVYCNGVQKHNVTIDGNPNDDAKVFTYSFNQAGSWTVKAQVKDKDMDDWSVTAYSVIVTVVAQPQVVLKTSEEGYSETGKKQFVTVGFDFFEATAPLVVMVTVEPPAGVNPGRLQLDQEYRLAIPGFPALGDNQYYIKLNGIGEERILIADLDGTELSSSKGFTVKAQVVHGDTITDDDRYADAGGQLWSEYYLPASEKAYVENEPPVAVVTPENTNAWQVAGGLATSYPIRWQVRSDVDADFEGTTEFPGVKVSFTGADNDTSDWVTEAKSGVFTPNFGSSQGDRTVTMTIEDKDGGIITKTYLYTITPSKFLVTVPSGPSGQATALSLRYRLADGIGQGYIYVPGTILSLVENFRGKWNCSKNPQASAYGYGYRVDTPEDDGTLNGGQDVAIDPNGNSVGAGPGNYYRYPAADEADEAARRDSYLYGWLSAATDDNGNAQSQTMTIAVEVPTQAPVPAAVSLPTKENDDGGYLDTTIEAVFAKEWRPADNAGDINQDGIPDLFAIKTWKGGKLINLVYGTEDAENDLSDLAESNPDEDYLPGVWEFEGEQTLVDNAKSSYAPVGVKFTTLRELRGFGEGLNATDSGIASDPDLTEPEQAARKAYYEAHIQTGAEPWIDPAVYPDADSLPLSVWSPEPGSAEYPRMDPTLVDTDGDRLPDGWEYYFWYHAHVMAPAGELKPRGGQTYVFERMKMSLTAEERNDPDKVAWLMRAFAVEGEKIEPEEVEKWFNPCVKRDVKAAGYNDDFDRDGLSDYEELLIGTNPCHWDTDGDHMGDGWEVMSALDPLNGGQYGNDDGDFMAFHDMREDIIWSDGTREYSLQNLAAYIDYDPISMVTLRDLNKIEAFSFEATEWLYGRIEDRPQEISVDSIYHRTLGRATGRTIVQHIDKGVTLGAGADLILIHDQVHKAFGFDPRTGWYDTGKGYVADRWDPIANKGLQPTDTTGKAVNTRPYFNYDEYLVMRYRYLFYNQNNEYYWAEETNTEKLGGGSGDLWGYIRSKTTMPSIVLSTTTSVTNETTDATGNTTNTLVEVTENTSAKEIANKLAELFAQAGSDKAVRVVHGADTDEDGVPDGWELYMYRDPCSPPTVDEDGAGLSGAADWDGDSLSWAQEFAGTDSCNAYSGCESIYKNHPGNLSGWFNKFFPTDPGTFNKFGMGPVDGSGTDTDGDGINDAAEGSVWTSVFYNGGKATQQVKFGFIYGEPEDDGSCCIRGGGMNPCTIDTDQDGLPDGWEMQFAGVPVDKVTLKPVPPSGSSKALSEIAESTLIADGLKQAAGLEATNATENATSTDDASSVYIAGGMDATWSGDVCTDLGSGSYDSRLGRVRDVDFDHDGLQNYQEYLVQSMRHFRYDDISTPLMGRLMSGADGQHAQTFIGYVPFNASDPDQFMISVVENCGPQFNINPQDFVKVVTVTTGVHVATTPDGAGGLVTNLTYYTAQQKQLIRSLPAALAERLVADENDPYRHPWTVEGWRKLGYFAPPAKHYDRSLCSGNFTYPVYMLPITGKMCVDAAAAGYASTDPRMADTDVDGMDDYWELFHGLNPLLGTTAEDPSDSHYNYGKSGDIISAVIWMGVYPTAKTTPTYNGFYNEWIYPAFNGLNGRTGVMQDGLNPLEAPLAYDPVLYPWTLGSSMADADGDGLRNGDERILANQASPSPSHTDPSPLWFTESSTKMSYVWQYYNMPPYTGDMFKTPDYTDAINETAARGGASAMYSTYVTDSDGMYICAFEENEGYDTDGDWEDDNREMITTTRAASDPLKFGDPDRRQALYLDGDKSYVMSRAMQLRTLNSFDLLRQFTVECWVRPELTGRAQTILERSCAYPGGAITKDAVAIRANFRLGLDADGTVYGLFDNSDAVESGQNAPVSCQRVDGGTLPLEKWSHVAMTYDGKTLAIYVDGVKRSTVQTTLIPANGVYNIVQNLERRGGFPYEVADATAAAFFIGARPVKESLNALYPYFVSDGVHRESFDNLREYFKGYVDEVRVWDGARTAAQIEENCRKRMTFEDVRANRDEVYLSWYGQGPSIKRKVDGTATFASTGATRNDNDGRTTLPAELLFHYNFQTLPAAARRSEVASTPTGFAKAVAQAAENDYASNPDIGEQVNQLYPLANLKGESNGQVRGRLRIGWWDESLVKSTAYRDTRVIPWIQNTVAHLDPLDGSCIDSFYYGTELAAQYLPASDMKVDSYAFPNSAIPYGWIAYDLDRYNRYFAYMRLAAQVGEEYAASWARYVFRVRTDFLNTTDLVPLGGAFAKLCPDYWDGAGPMDVWANFGRDTDADGLPDWWEEYARANYCENLSSAATLDWNTKITYNGVLMEAWMAYMLDLNSGMQPDGSIREDLAQTADANGNNIPDWWEKIFGLEGCDPDGDADNDGLSNYAEYLISFGPEPYGYNRGWPMLNPCNAKTGLGQQVLDYYLVGPTNDIHAAGEHISAYSYLGEIVTDHDFMEQWWEKLYGVDYVNSYVYDPNRDADGDGWSNFAENKAYVWGGAFSAVLIDRYIDGNSENHLKCYPRPAVGFKVTYFGNQDVSGKGLVVRASSANSQRVDATFVAESSSADVNQRTKTCILGGYSHDAVIHGYLHPGNIVPGDEHFQFCQLSDDRTYRWSVRWELDNGETEWRSFTGSHSAYMQALIRYGRDNVILEEKQLEFNDFARSASDSVGNYGDIRLAVTNVTSSAIIGKINYRTGEYSIDLSKVTAAGVNLEGVVFRADYTYQLGDEWPKTVWVSEPAEGWLKEGVNTFEVSIDLDGNGTYDVGEPYGTVTGVDVGWYRRGPITIELTDEATNFGRTSVAVDSGAVSQQVIVRRSSINGVSAIDGKQVPQRTLGSRLLVAGNREYLTEADILTADKPDLDWKWLVRDALRLGLDQSSIRQVGYDIEVRTDIGDGVVTNLPVSTFYVDYGTSSRPRPVVQSPVSDAPVYSAQPTFVFSSNDELMHAYRLQIADSATNLVYDSGAVRLPGRANWTSGTPAYQVTPAVYAGCPIGAKASPMLKDGERYLWRAMLLNAKYSNEDEAAYSPWTQFQFDLANANRHPLSPTGYGNCAAVVRYYGVAQTNDLAGAVVVEAFASPDFSGNPLARIRLGDVSQLSDTGDISTTNAVLRGIAPGEVYLRAFIDFNDNGVKDDWESWGYANHIGSDEPAIYKPRAVEVTDVFNAYPSLTIFIEDCDVNQNEIPDPLDTFLGSGTGGSGGGTGGIIGSDGDGDGLSDDEEGNYATDPAASDSDGDGMPDGWEALFADTDPTYPDGDETSEGDVMAYAEVQGVVITLDDGASYLLDPGAKLPQVGDWATNAALRTTYDYNKVKGYGSPAAVAEGLRVAGVATNVTVALVHAQVYERFGFNPLTANPAVSSNEWVNTKPFTALDKYLVVRYLEALGLADEDAVNRNRLWAQYTLKPGDADCDSDGVPDGWELYVMFGRGGVTGTLAEAKVTPWDDTPDNVRDPAKAPDGGGLSILDEFDRGQMPTDPWNVDTDGDMVSDFYAHRYHLKGEMAREDADGDGLSNYAEYLITEVFRFANLDPNNAMTDGSTRDYFRKVGELYLGEVFSDHDQVDNAWEILHEKANSSGRLYANSSVYDPAADLDGDGWTNYDEARAGTDPETSVTLGIDGYQLVEHPVPIVEMNIVYNGPQAFTGALKIQAWNQARDPKLEQIPCAAWTVGRVATTTTTTQIGNNTETDTAANEKYVGMQPHGTRTYHLGPGMIRENSFKLYFKDTNFVKVQEVNIMGEVYYQAVAIGLVEDAVWYYMVVDQGGKLVTTGGIAAESHEVGTIDYKTGKVTINFDDPDLTCLRVADPGVAQTNGNNNNNNNNSGLYDGINLDASYVKMEWVSSSVGSTLAGTYYLGDPDPSATTPNAVNLLPGLTTFTAELTSSNEDTDTADTTTAKQRLFGVVRDVEVGWAGAKATIELTDYSALTPRLEIWAGTADRTTTLANLDPRIDIGTNRVEASPAVETPVRVRVARYAINGWPAYQVGVNPNLDATGVIYDAVRASNGRTELNEADFIADGSPDIDWATFETRIAKNRNVTQTTLSVTNMTYLVVLGDGPVGFNSNADEGPVTALGMGGQPLLIERRFDVARPRPAIVDTNLIVYSARPTFAWSMPGESDYAKRYGSSYTAFQILLFDADENLVWDSGIRRAPAADALGRFSWTAPVSVGQLVEAGAIKPATDYRWTVSMFNSKFKTADSEGWSAYGKVHFLANVQSPMNDHGYSTVHAAVKYAGPSAVTNAPLRVQAFTNADCAGEPLAEVLADDLVAVTDLVDVTGNVEVRGLPANGEYYLRAFFDTNRNGVKDDWESYGQTAEPVVLTSALTRPPVAAVWIEDADTDGDWIPDAYEMEIKGNLTDMTLAADGDGLLTLKTSAYVMVTNGTAGISTGLPGASFTAMQSADFVSALLGIAGSDSTRTSIEIINDAVARKIVPNTVRVTSFVLDPAAKKVILGVEADVAPGIAGEWLERWYKTGATGEAVVTVKVYRKASLAEAGWTEIFSQPGVRLGTGAEMVEVDVSGAGELSSGFFKIDVVQ